MSQKLFEDWEDYDNKKIRDHRDSKFFSCEEPWEVDYLVKKIRSVYPSIPEQNVRIAIGVCCTHVSAPRPRKQFVDCVARRLGISPI